MKVSQTQHMTKFTNINGMQKPIQVAKFTPDSGGSSYNKNCVNSFCVETSFIFEVFRGDKYNLTATMRPYRKN